MGVRERDLVVSNFFFKVFDGVSVLYVYERILRFYVG